MQGENQVKCEQLVNMGQNLPGFVNQMAPTEVNVDSRI